MIDFSGFCSFTEIDPSRAKFQRIAWLLAHDFKPTTPQALWEEGYDYGEYEGPLELAEDDDTIIVRAILTDGAMELHAHTCAFDPGNPEDFLSWTEKLHDHYGVL